jgi:hypothetical protein
MNKRFQAALGVVCFGLMAADAWAVDSAVTAKLGTLGLGVEGTFGLTEHFNARLGLNKFDFDRTDTIDDIEYDLDLEWQSISLLADWHPFGNEFRFTAGLLSNSNELSGSSTSDSVTIGNTPYGNVGLDAKLDFDATAPYLGVGWGNALSANKGWGFNVDVGILYQGSGDVTLTPTGSGASLVDPADIAAEEQKFEDDIKDYKYYPVFSFGVSYRF